MSRPVARALGLGVVAVLAGAPGLAAQEIRFEAEREEGRFEFSRAWFSVAERVRETRRRLAATGDFGALNIHFSDGVADASTAAAARTAVAGTYRVPVLATYFADSTHAYQPPIGDLADKLFDPSAAYSVTTYYDEVSAGLADVTGDLYGWFETEHPHTYYGDSDGNGFSPYDNIGEFIVDLLDQAEAAGVDFSLYDVDGDDFVDVLAIVHPLSPFQCRAHVPNSNFGSHRSFLSAWTGGAYLTDDGVFVNDYILQSATGGNLCDVEQIMEIGTFSHELGHAFGLPDLYDSGDEFGQGIGHWGLMGSGNWNRQDSPAHLSAWSKDRLGWIAIDTIVAGASATTRTVEPTIEEPAAMQLDVPNSHEYFLVENRQPLGSDAHLAAPGLLVWHIDPSTSNFSTPYGVAVEQADGLLHLEGGDNRGDAGDPFPGATGSTALTPETLPSSDLNTGNRSWVRITGIQENEDGSIEFGVASSAPDLVVEADPFQVTPDTVLPGELIRGPAWTIRNVGALESGEFRSGLYLSPDSLVTAADDRSEFDVEEIHANLGAGESVTVDSSAWEVPVSFPAGDYYVGFLVDDSSTVNELDESNNYLSTRISVAPLPSIFVELGADSILRAAVDSLLTLPVLVDMAGAEGEDVASLQVEITWDPSLLIYEEVTAGDFDTFDADTESTGDGTLSASLSSATGTTENVVALNLSVATGSTETDAAIDLVVQAAHTGAAEDITDYVDARGLAVCIGQPGLWGDVTGDDVVDIVDAQRIGRHSADLDVTDPERVVSHGDVTADESANVIDAQQIARHSVGLPTDGRAGVPIACE